KRTVAMPARGSSAGGRGPSGAVSIATTSRLRASSGSRGTRHPYALDDEQVTTDVDLLHRVGADSVSPTRTPLRGPAFNEATASQENAKRRKRVPARSKSQGWSRKSRPMKRQVR